MTGIRGDPILSSRNRRKESSERPDVKDQEEQIVDDLMVTKATRLMRWPRRVQMSGSTW